MSLYCLKPCLVKTSVSQKEEDGGEGPEEGG